MTAGVSVVVHLSTGEKGRNTWCSGSAGICLVSMLRCLGQQEEAA